MSCSALQCGAVRCGALRCVAVRCGALQCVAVSVCLSDLHQHAATQRKYALQCVAVCCSVGLPVQFTPFYNRCMETAIGCSGCSVLRLQRFAVCYSVGLSTDIPSKEYMCESIRMYDMLACAHAHTHTQITITPYTQPQHLHTHTQYTCCNTYCNTYCNTHTHTHSHPTLNLYTYTQLHTAQTHTLASVCACV